MKKNKLGQYFTKKNYWQQNQVIDYIGKYNIKTLVDPFAGKGDLLYTNTLSKKIKRVGMDIDKSLCDDEIFHNNSLKYIKNYKGGFVLTNPPYLSKSSAKRKGFDCNEFTNSKQDDLYKIALEKLFESKMPGVAIIPESFINSKFSKEHIYSITILIPNPFTDTDVPVCIICYDPNKTFDQTLVYKNNELLGEMNFIKEKCTKILDRKNESKVKFNMEHGELALIAYDSFGGKKIRFLKSSELLYGRPQKISSRVISKIDTDIKINKDIILELNKKLVSYRNFTYDIFLSPFKGNDKNHNRRRRLDYKTARLIINSIKTY